ncbi:MBOAT family protein [Frankia sp. CNm7]|uniref:MBOAT family protein n=1 Tax=Frankia nepalensis TaxID=1836974 RepID=A0A937USR7_9ACTN|nr:MBOAT family protein [Frankia nepalensis]MBL7498585.1 MBOAT family protein [Frankia nepalensis]MBL7515036.1 MBOAT family protein [Frankia nepalensis]MBL7519418.1 MBOAT family protein [Frankia nepalensis]MBL7629176.1 MBOAT family protein [Frankia nepalensis]
MVFPTIEFAAFFLAVMAVSWWLMPRPRLWKPFMLAASYVFYGYTDPRFVLLLVASTLVNQAAACAIARRRDRRILIIAIVADLGLLGWFKYYGFFALSVDRMLDDIGLGAPLPLLQVALPVGISFFTFQALSYVIDVWRGDTRPAKLIDFAVYEAFFPHLVAGPIVRAREFIPQLASPRDRSAVPATRAVFLICGGLVKKVVLADLLARRLVDPVFDSPGQHSSVEVLVAIYAYAVQIYCDFSAYSDIAIGVALLLGFRFPDNFDRPYAATSLREFWRRWHLTLSRWLRDYVYIPLGGARRGPRRTQLNLMITMVLGGLWHGAAWTFVCWGAVHGAGLAAERSLAHRHGARDTGEASRGPWRPSRHSHGARDTGEASRGPWPVRLRGRHRPRRGEPAIPVPTEVTAVGLVAIPAPRSVGEERAPASPPVTAPALAAVVAREPAGTGRGDVAVDAVGSTSALAVGRPAAHSPEATATGRWLRRIVTFHVVCGAWVLFRSPDLATAGEIMRRLVTGGFAIGLVTPTVVAAIVVGLGLAAVPARWWTAAQVAFDRLTLPVQVLGVVGFLLAMYSFVGQQDVAPFIYFRF